MKIFQAVFAAALVATAVTAAVVASGGAHQVKASANPGDGNVQIVNVSEQGFGVAWTTTGSYTGSSVLYGTSCAGATHSVGELASNGKVHLANLSGLLPNTKYYYKLVANGVTDNNNGACYTATTFASQSRPPLPAAIYGQADRSGCHEAAPGALVVLTDGNSSPLAAISDSQGRWALPFGDLTDATGTYLNPGAATVLTVALSTDAFHARALKTDGTGSDPAPYNGTAQTVGPIQVCTVPAVAAITINSVTTTAAYSGHPHAVTATTNPAGLSYTVSYNGSSIVPTNAGTYPVTVTVSDPDWTGSSNGTLVIRKVSAIVTASSAGIVFGQAVPAVTHSYSGFVNGETASVVSGTPACSTTATASSPAGMYPTSCKVSSLSATNYSFSAVPGTPRSLWPAPSSPTPGRIAIRTIRRLPFRRL